jgi:hypothetical protein
MTESVYPQHGKNKPAFKQEGSFALFGPVAIPRISQVFRILGRDGGSMAKTELEGKADPQALAKAIEMRYVGETGGNYQLTTEGVNFYNGIVAADAEEEAPALPQSEFLPPSAALEVGNFDTPETPPIV